MQTMNEMVTDRSNVLTGKVQPVKNAIMLTVLDAANSPQTVTLNQHRHSIEKYLPIGSQSLKESSFVSTKSMSTGGAVITTLNMAVDSDVVSLYLAKIWTRFLIAPLRLNFHSASPCFGRCANHNLKFGFPGLAGQHQEFGPVEIAIP